MNVTLIGCGCGCLTLEAQTAIDRAELLVGSKRLLQQYAGERTAEEAVVATEIRDKIISGNSGEVCVLYSGDSGFFSGARQLLPLLEKEKNMKIRVIPGISSLQVFAAHLERPWQEWKLCSAHGTDCDAVNAVCEGRPVFFLTGGQQDPAELCRELAEAGLGFLRVSIGERLGTEQEKIITGTAKEFAEGTFSALSVLLAEPAPRPEKRAPGLPDGNFVRADGIPMTKQEIRAIALSKLGISPDDVCWDIGAGTGSVSVELALQAKKVYGIEKNREAVSLAEENRKKHGAWNLKMITGEAPEVLERLPKPDVVFVGGSGGKLRDVLEAVHTVNPMARICITAITLETLHLATETLNRFFQNTGVCQVSVTHGRKVGEHTIMLAGNPVWLITGNTE